MKRVGPKRSSTTSLPAAIIFLPLLVVQVLTPGCGSYASATDQKPSLVTSDGHPALVLPQPLLDKLKVSFSGFRVPGEPDMSKAWVSERTSTRLPFVTWGDYDGNNLTDVAVLLLSDREWKLVAFNQVAGGKYDAVSLNGGDISDAGGNLQCPQEITLATLPKGEEYVVDSGEKARRGKFNFDAIEFIAVNSSLWIYYWSEGTFQQIVFGYE